MRLFMFALGAVLVGFGIVIIRERTSALHVVAGAVIILAGILFMVPALWP